MDINDVYWKPIHFISGCLGKLTYLHIAYRSCIPRWHNQPHYVEAWIEKDTVVGTFKSILKGRQVRIVPVNQYFEEIYDEALKKYSPKEIYTLVNESVLEFLNGRGTYNDDDAEGELET